MSSRASFPARETVDEAGGFTLLRRPKLWLDAIPPDVLDSAADLGLLVGRLGLTDGRGHPLCAGVPPPVIEWSGGGRAVTGSGRESR